MNHHLHSKGIKMLLDDSGGGMTQGGGFGFWHAVAAAAGSAITFLATVIRDWRRGSAEADSLEADTAGKVIGEWKKLYEEQRERAARLQDRCDSLQQRCDELQSRLDAVETAAATERREFQRKIYELSQRVAHCEAYHATATGDATKES